MPPALVTPLEYITGAVPPWVELGVLMLIVMDALAHGAVELGGPELCAAGDGGGIRARCDCGEGAAQTSQITVKTLGRNRAESWRGRAGERRHQLRRPEHNPGPKAARPANESDAADRHYRGIHHGG